MAGKQSRHFQRVCESLRAYYRNGPMGAAVGNPCVNICQNMFTGLRSGVVFEQAAQHPGGFFVDF